jgi:hypothetical protein
MKELETIKNALHEAAAKHETEKKFLSLEIGESKKPVKH